MYFTLPKLSQVSFLNYYQGAVILLFVLQINMKLTWSLIILILPVWNISSLQDSDMSCSDCRTGGDIFTRRYKMPKEPNYRQIEKKILDDVLSPDLYDPRIRPAGLNTTGELPNWFHQPLPAKFILKWFYCKMWRLIPLFLFVKVFLLFQMVHHLSM